MYNFAAPLEPIALTLPPGGGRAFKLDLHRMVESIKSIIRLHAESADAKRLGADLELEAEAKENVLLTGFEAELLADGFKLVQVGASDGAAMDIVPTADGVAGTAIWIA